MNEERNSLKLLISQNLISTCRNNFDYKQELKVEALIAITLDNKEIILINVNDSINFNTNTTSPYFETSHFNTSNFRKPFRNDSCTDDNYLVHDNNDENCSKNNVTEESENSINHKNFCVSEKHFEQPSNNSNLAFDSNSLVNFFKLKVIEPLDSYHDDITDENSSNNCENDVKITPISPKRFDSHHVTTIQNGSSFPKISLKSYSPNRVQNQVKVFINKNIALNSNKRKFSEQTYHNDEKRIVLHSNIKSAKLIQKPSIQQSENDSIESNVPTTSSAQPSLSGTNKSIISTASENNTVSNVNEVAKK